MSLIVLLLLPFVGSCLAAVLPHNARNSESLLAGLIALIGTVQVALLYPQIAHGGVIREEFMWLPSLGLNFVLRLDGFAWLFSILVLGIGTLVSLYARYYMSPEDPVPRFFAFFLAFMGAMLGLVLSGNLIQIVFFWELTSLFSFLLIGYWHHRSDARRGAYMALMVTGAGGLCLLAGVMLLGHVVGSYDLDAVLAAGDKIRAHSLYPILLPLILIGALSKSAQFPFHFWLPHAMAAPTPVSAYLHSATMVKAGVFLLIRLWPVLSGTEAWSLIIGGAGVCTLLIGAFIAIFQHDLKGLLAYSTISHLGLITLLLGLNSPLAAVAAVFHMMNHATFKASLFMSVGIIDHETGTRDMRRLGNLRRWMPMTSALAITASLAMAGIPLLNGFLSKEMFYTEALEIGGHHWWRIGINIAALLYGIFGVAYSLRFVYETFFGSGPRALDHMPHEPPRWMKIPVEVLVVLCVAVGVAPALTVAPVLHAGAGAILGDALPDYSLAIWHGFNKPLMMSLAGTFGGIALYFGLRRLFDLHAIVRHSLGRRAFRWNMEALYALAGRFTSGVANGSLQRSLVWLVLAALAAGAAPFLSGSHAPLVLLCVAVGVAPAWTIAPVLQAGAGAILGEAMPHYSLAVWHGLNRPLLMSLAGIVGGVALYFGLRRLLDLHAIMRSSLGRQVFRWNMEALYALAARFTTGLANGSLQRSMVWLVAAALFAGAAPFLSGVSPPLQWRAPQPMPLLGWLLWLVLLACTAWTIKFYRQRLLALVVLGGAGLMVSLTFVFLSAPDLALTQLLVEMVSLALLLLGLHYLPARSPPERTPRRRLRDIAVAAAAGLGLGLLSYAVMTRVPGEPASLEMLARSLPEAYGRNVVNVILVDFRGFDTFGEITVFGVAALIVHALLRRARMAPEKVMAGPPVKLPVPADLAQIMFPLTLTVSVFLFLRGHNAPGGGFIAGLVLAVPLLIQYVIQGAASVESRFGFDYIKCIAVGLVVAAASGAASFLFGLEFLTSGHAELDLPLLGELELASAMGFDTGVYLVVFGGAMLILSMLGTIKPSRTRVARLGVIEPGERSTLTGERP